MNDGSLTVDLSGPKVYWSRSIASAADKPDRFFPYTRTLAYEKVAVSGVLTHQIHQESIFHDSSSSVPPPSVRTRSPKNTVPPSLCPRSIPSRFFIRVEKDTCAIGRSPPFSAHR
jgi:hypothetical protein